jgi:hypothetical protein
MKLIIDLEQPVFEDRDWETSIGSLIREEIGNHVRALVKKELKERERDTRALVKEAVGQLLKSSEAVKQLATTAALAALDKAT